MHTNTHLSIPPPFSTLALLNLMGRVGWGQGRLMGERRTIEVYIFAWDTKIITISIIIPHK